jgi:hypothetical protein
LRTRLTTLLFATAALGYAGDLAQVLDSAASRALELSTELSAVACVETMTQAKVDAKGKVLAQREAMFDYLVMLQPNGAELNVEESRIEKTRREKKSRVSLLISEGFSVLALILHPHYQSAFSFRDLGAGATPGTRRLAFSHVPGERTPSALALKGREYPIDWEGVATLREDTWDIVRIEARLPQTMAELGLLKLDATVNYSPVRFRNEDRSFWLPETATIEVASRRQQWRNVHRFASYRRFNVETTVRTGAE